MTKPLRVSMPVVAEFVDACRDAFGADMINEQIQLGRQGAQTFYACENGIEIGTRIAEPKIFITADRMVLRSKKELAEIDKLRRKFKYE